MESCSQKMLLLFTNFVQLSNLFRAFVSRLLNCINRC